MWLWISPGTILESRSDKTFQAGCINSLYLLTTIMGCLGGKYLNRVEFKFEFVIKTTLPSVI